MAIFADDQMLDGTGPGNDGRGAFAERLGGHRFLVLMGQHFTPPANGAENGRDQADIGKDDVGDQAGPQKSQTHCEEKRRSRGSGQIDRLFLFFGHASVLRFPKCR